MVWFNMRVLCGEGGKEEGRMWVGFSKGGREQGGGSGGWELEEAITAVQAGGETEASSTKVEELSFLGTITLASGSFPLRWTVFCFAG